MIIEWERNLQKLLRYSVMFFWTKVTALCLFDSNDISRSGWELTYLQFRFPQKDIITIFNDNYQ